MKSTLSAFGYTEREARFLRLCSLSSGYFIRRQFNDFIGRQSGALAERFIERGKRLGHFVELKAMARHSVLHVRGNGIYTALEDDQNRNRRGHRTDAIRRRLLALDVVLQNSGENFLLKASERSAIERLEAGKDLGGTGWSEPVRVLPENVLELTFLDDGVGSYARWKTFLKRRIELLKVFEKAVVVFASAGTVRFQRAEEFFRAEIAGETHAGALDLARVQSFFETRQLVEARAFGELTQSRLDAYRDDRRVYSGHDFEQLYGQWLSTRKLVAASKSLVRFEALLLPFSYDWLSPVRFQSRRR